MKFSLLKLKNLYINILLGGFFGSLCATLLLSLVRFFFGGWSNLFDGVVPKYDLSYSLSYLVVDLGVLFYLPIIYFFTFLYKIVFRRTFLKGKKVMISSFSYILFQTIYIDMFAKISSTGPDYSISTVDFVLRIILMFIYPAIFLYLISSKKSNI